MAFILQGKKLYDNEWTSAIISKKECWENYADERNLKIEGTYSNRHCEFALKILLIGAEIVLKGHRNFVDLPNVVLIEDVYNEVFSIIFKSNKPLNFPYLRSIRNNLIGLIFLKVKSLKGIQLNDKLTIGCKDIKDVKTLSEFGFLKLENIRSVKVNSRGINIRYGSLFTGVQEIKQIDEIIESLKKLHNK